MPREGRRPFEAIQRNRPNLHRPPLPQGRPEGPAFASRQFRAAVPDLKVTVEKDDHRRGLCHRPHELTGHFTGTLVDHQRPQSVKVS